MNFFDILRLLPFEFSIYELPDVNALFNSPAPGALPVLPGPGVPDVFVTHGGCGSDRRSPTTILQRWSQFGKGRAVFVNRKYQEEEEHKFFYICEM